MTIFHECNSKRSFLKHLKTKWFSSRQPLLPIILNNQALLFFFLRLNDFSLKSKTQQCLNGHFTKKNTNSNNNGSPKTSNLKILKSLLWRSGCAGQPPDALGYGEVYRQNKMKFWRDKFQAHFTEKSKQRALFMHRQRSWPGKDTGKLINLKILKTKVQKSKIF